MRRRYFLTYLVIIGFLCVSFASASKKVSSVENNVNPRVIPLSFGSFEPEGCFNFQYHEYLNRTDHWRYHQSSFELPLAENFTDFSSTIVFQVQNDSIPYPTLYTSSDSLTENNNINNDYDYAQRFDLSMNCTLLNFSFPIEIGGQNTQFHLEIRNHSYNGTIVFSEDVTILKSYESDWYHYHFSPFLELSSGKYYLIIEPQASGPQYVKLRRTLDAINTTETWIYDTSWQLANFDLPLRMNITQFLSPEQVNLKVGDTSVLNFGENQGILSISNNITDIIFTAPISANGLVNISYFSQTTFHDVTSPDCSINLVGNSFFWNLSFTSQNYSDPYTDYWAKITNLQSDYSQFGLYYTNSSVDYEKLSNNDLIIFDAVTHLVFQSPNYLSSVFIQDQIIVGQNTTFSVTALDYGNFSLLIRNYNTITYSETQFNNQQSIFSWYVDPEENYQNLTLEVLFTGENEIGYLSMPLSVIARTKIVSTDFSVKTLDIVEVAISFENYYLTTPISNASVQLEFLDFRIFLHESTVGAYSGILDLESWGVSAGNYSMVVTAQKDGYVEDFLEIPIEIQKREAIIEFTKDRTKLKEKQTFSYSLVLQDEQSSTYLSRPVQIETRIYLSRDQNPNSLIHFQAFEGVSTNLDIEWVTPEHIEPSMYDIIISINSQYYQGSLHVSEAFEITPKIGWYIYIFLILGVGAIGMVALFSYIEQVRRSLLGIIFLHANGMPLAKNVSGELLEKDIVLISAAMTGVITIIKEITGSQARVIEIEGGFLHISKREGYWVIIFLEKHPKWIAHIISKFILDFQNFYLNSEVLARPHPIWLDFGPLTEKYFHCTLDQEKSDQIPLLEGKDETEIDETEIDETEIDETDY